MRRLGFLLLSFLVLLIACNKQQGEKLLYPAKATLGNTTYEFYYNQGRVYSVIASRPKYQGTFTFRYCDEYFKEPEHPFKDKIFAVNYEPDRSTAGWDGSDSAFAVLGKQTLLPRNPETGSVSNEWQSENYYKAGKHKHRSDEVKHKYNQQNQLIESAYYTTSDSSDLGLPEVLLSKRVIYAYKQGKLAKVTYLTPDTGKPYLVIELEYDDKTGYLKNLPLEARFLTLELPYRHYNITSYKVKDGQGKIRKDLSYTCSYTYNQDGYPNTFTRNMLNGQQVKGYMVYNIGGLAGQLCLFLKYIDKPVSKRTLNQLLYALDYRH